MLPELKQFYRALSIRFPDAMKYPTLLARRALRGRGPGHGGDIAVLAHFRPPEGTVFVDIGANVGQSLARMRLHHPRVPVISFEPHPLAYRTLAAEAARLGHAVAVQAALGDRAGTLTLYTPHYRGVPYRVLASTDRAEAAGWIERHAGMFYDPAQLEIAEDTVPLEALDARGLRPSFLKLDTQGTEDRVIRGAMRTIEAHRPLILLEQSPEDRVTGLLAPLGYRAFRYEGGRLLPGAERRTDALFVPEERRGDLRVPFG